MKLTNDGLTLWYATPDAPGPFEDDASRAGSFLTVGVKPPSPSNTVLVHYRIDGGAPRMFPVPEVGTDYDRRVQYFRARFPPMPHGRVVEYCPVVSCGGRQAPAPSTTWSYPSRFTLTDRPLPLSGLADPPSPPQPVIEAKPRFATRLEFIAAVHAQFSQQVDVVGETPIGLRVNYFIEGGVVVGERVRGKVLPRGGDFLLIRRDGVGSVQVQCTFQTDDGAHLGAEYYGIVDLGPDGYQRAVCGKFPSVAALQLAPRFMTGDPRYLWMNRGQFIGVGRVDPNNELVDYDLFLVSNDPIGRQER